MKKALSAVGVVMVVTFVGVFASLVRPFLGLFAAWVATVVAGWFGHTDVPAWFFWAVMAGTMVVPSATGKSE